MRANYEESYRQLEKGEKSPQDFTVEFLFEMASEFVVGGDFAAKKKIYEEFILRHPWASIDDKARVLVYRADLQRRDGDPKAALEILKTIEPPKEKIAWAEFLQAAGQCCLKLGDLKQALPLQRQIIRLFTGGKIPVDKKLYYLEGMMAMKLAGDEADEELDELFRTYEQLLSNSLLSGVIESRAEAALATLRGRAEFRKGNLTAAANYYWQCLETAPAVRDKAVAALEFLHCRWRIDPNDNSPLVRKAAEFYKTNWKTMQTTDITELQPKFELVMQKLELI